MSRKAIAIINLYILLIVYDTHLYSILSPHIRFLQIYHRGLLLFVSFKEMRRLMIIVFTKQLVLLLDVSVKTVLSDSQNCI